MFNDDTNIYARCRRARGITQEYAAELLGVATRTVAAWEAGERIPSGVMVARMVDVYQTPVLALEHLRLNDALAREYIPRIAETPLPQAVCQLVSAVRNFAAIEGEDRLLDIAADGKVDELEKAEYEMLLDALEPIIQAAMTLRIAAGG
ncbi:MAG: helix-turn-helix transcriptional regulator [Firmicutes bacterium]|nr:helix-turn-helix transcriptional regulator [Bacillota bacterium]